VLAQYQGHRKRYAAARCRCVAETVFSAVLPRLAFRLLARHLVAWPCTLRPQALHALAEAVSCQRRLGLPARPQRLNSHIYLARSSGSPSAAALSQPLQSGFCAAADYAAAEQARSKQAQFMAPAATLTGSGVA